MSSFKMTKYIIETIQQDKGSQIYLHSKGQYL